MGRVRGKEAEQKRAAIPKFEISPIEWRRRRCDVEQRVDWLFMRSSFSHFALGKREPGLPFHFLRFLRKHNRQPTWDSFTRQAYAPGPRPRAHLLPRGPLCNVHISLSTQRSPSEPPGGNPSGTWPRNSPKAAATTPRDPWEPLHTAQRRSNGRTLLHLRKVSPKPEAFHKTPYRIAT